jgi:acetoacetate decarboxylase
MTWLFTYLDCPGDKTNGGEIAAIAGRGLTGFMKRIGNVSLTGDGDECTGVLERRGVKLMTLKCKFDKKISADDLPFAVVEQFFYVQEIPNESFTGYDVRKVVAQPTSFLSDYLKSARIGTGSVELGHLASDPLDWLGVVEIPGQAYEVVIDVGTEACTGAYAVDDLLK